MESKLNKNNTDSFHLNLGNQKSSEWYIDNNLFAFID